MPRVLALLGVFLIGLSKAGFATGLGMLSTPLMAQALPARTAIGVILPLLCLADVFTLAVYWRRWDLRLVAWPLVGTAPRHRLRHRLRHARSASSRLRRSIGAVGLVLTLLLVVRNRYHPHAVYRPRPWHGVLVGVAAGVSSTIAHAAGPDPGPLPPRAAPREDALRGHHRRLLHGEQPAQGPALRRQPASSTRDPRPLAPLRGGHSPRHRRRLVGQPSPARSATSTRWSWSLMIVDLAATCLWPRSGRS